MTGTHTSKRYPTALNEFAPHDPCEPGTSKRGQSIVQFSGHFYCGQAAGCIKMPLGMEVGLSPGDWVLDGDRGPPPKKGAEPHPQFSVHVYCDQTAGWMIMALGMEVGLGPGKKIVLDGDRERGYYKVVPWCPDGDFLLIFTLKYQRWAKLSTRTWWWPPSRI